MKKPNLKKPSLPKAVPFKRRKAPEQRVTEALENVPRITNETVAEHREEVLSSARKFIYPLQHSKHRVVRISTLIIIAALLGFFVYCTAAIYKFQSTSGFIYGVSRVIPFPIAKVGPTWVSYESYLFQLRRKMHYYHTQQGVNFSDKVAKTQLVQLKKEAMNQVITDAEVKQLAAKNHVTVTNEAVNNQLQLTKAQNRLANDRVLRNVLNKFWGWNIADFQRQLKQELLQQAVVAKLDVATNQRAKAAYVQLQNGADFATIAGAYSDDASTRGNGGAYGVAITPNFADLSPLVTAELFRLQAGQTSGIVNTGPSLEILRVTDKSGNTVHASHISFNFSPITVYTKPLQATNKPSEFIRL